MSNQPLPVLTEQQARVLFVVWKEKQSDRSKGMTNIEIREAVLKHASRANEPGTSLANIKKIIAQLENLKPPLLLSFRAGKQPKIFQLPKDSMVTWPSSAQILLFLDGDRRGTVDRNLFIQQMLRRDLKNSDSGKLLTKEDIEKQIDYCIARQFPYIEDDNNGSIKATDRVSFERPFLEKIEKYQRS